MSHQRIHLSGCFFDVAIPASLSVDEVRTVVVPTIMKGAEILLQTASSLRTVSVAVDPRRQTRIVYLDGHARVLRTDAIPALVMTRAQHPDTASDPPPHLLQDYLVELAATRRRQRLTEL